MSGRNTLGDNRTLGIFAQMDHLGTCIGLLVVVGHGYRVEFTDRIVASQDTTGILPGDGRTGLYLRPGDLASLALAQASFGHEVIDTPFALFIARIPVLYGRVFDLGMFVGYDFDNGSMQLALVPPGS